MESMDGFSSFFDRFFESMSKVPSSVYYFGMFGSMLTSLLLFLMGRRTTALFVGEWVPTILLTALFYKLLHPSTESMGSRTANALNEMTQ